MTYERNPKLTGKCSLWDKTIVLIVQALAARSQLMWSSDINLLTSNGVWCQLLHGASFFCSISTWFIACCLKTNLIQGDSQPPKMNESITKIHELILENRCWTTEELFDTISVSWSSWHWISRKELWMERNAEKVVSRSQKIKSSQSWMHVVNWKDSWKLIWTFFQRTSLVTKLLLLWLSLRNKAAIKSMERFKSPHPTKNACQVKFNGQDYADLFHWCKRNCPLNLFMLIKLLIRHFIWLFYKM